MDRTYESRYRHWLLVTTSAFRIRLATTHLSGTKREKWSKFDSMISTRSALTVQAASHCATASFCGNSHLPWLARLLTTGTVVSAYASRAATVHSIVDGSSATCPDCDEPSTGCPAATCSTFTTTAARQHTYNVRADATTFTRHTPCSTNSGFRSRAHNPKDTNPTCPITPCPFATFDPHDHPMMAKGLCFHNWQRVNYRAYISAIDTRRTLPSLLLIY